MFKPGQVAIVTGIGPGMGRSIAVGFAKQGVDVALAARRPERVEAVAQEIRALGRDPLVFPLDITDKEGCDKLVAATVEKFGGLDFLVQNGHDEGDWQLAEKAPLDRWRRVFEVNFFGTLQLAQAAIPHIRARGGGAMVFVNTGAALKAPPGMGAYAASKAAMASLVRTFAAELGKDKIRVNGAWLGATAGETLDHAATMAGPAQGLTAEEWMARKPLEFALGAIPTPDECAGTILYLCSDLSRVVTGHHVAVNGGQWIQ
jgi:NAD(P)-dependent dehydrogenase (short-subunit alcohol dehydrogenase family)